VVAGLACVSTPAYAAGEVVSITFSPLHLIQPVFEAQAEVRLLPALGLAAIGGVGSLRHEGTTFSVLELGGQIAAYPLDDFRSLQFGAEVLWIHVGGEKGDVTGTGAGTAVGPFVGYKLVTRHGFTFFAQGGAQYVFVKAEASNSAGETAEGSDSTFIPLLNLNFGWSF
jgi:hypothetical protein